MEHQTSDALEKSIDDDRRALDRTLRTLREKLDPQALAADGVKMMTDHAVPAFRRASRAVQDNPLAFALMGAGAAWLIFGGRSPEPKDKNPLAGTRAEAVARWEDEGGPPSPEADDDEEPWVAEADTLRSRAGEIIARIDQAARDKLAPAAELARSRADVIAALTQDVRTAMGRGLEDLGEQARSTAMAAREAAYSARIAVTEKGSATVKENPFLTGGLLAVAGAALAAALPRTQVEARTFGTLRDRLFEAVQEIAADEMKRAGVVARDLADTLRTDLDRAQEHVSEAGAAMVDQAGDRAEERPTATH